MAADRFAPEELLHDGGIDAGLYLLSLVTPRGVELTQEEIAEVCGCSRALIYLIEKRAIKKLKKKRYLLAGSRRGKGDGRGRESL